MDGDQPVLYCCCHFPIAAAHCTNNRVEGSPSNSRRLCRLMLVGQWSYRTTFDRLFFFRKLGALSLGLFISPNLHADSNRELKRFPYVLGFVHTHPHSSQKPLNDPFAFLRRSFLTFPHLLFSGCDGSFSGDSSSEHFEQSLALGHCTTVASNWATVGSHTRSTGTVGVRNQDPRWPTQRNWMGLIFSRDSNQLSSARRILI